MEAAFSAATAIIMFILGVFGQIQDASKPSQPQERPDRTEVSDVGDVLTIYSLNDEFKDYMGGYVPEGVKLDYITDFASFNSDELYRVIREGVYGEPVDIYIVDSDVLCRYLSEDTALPVSRLGITDDDLSGLYGFSRENAENAAGEVCALPVVSAPGVFLYHRSAAKKLFGTDDPAVVQSNISDWKKFLQTAELAKSKDIYMTTSVNDMYRVFTSGSSFTGSDGSLSLPSSALDWYTAAQTMAKNGYELGFQPWTNEWTNSFTDENVFGYFTASWYVEAIIPILSDSSDYAVCAGPQYFYWGGSYAVVNPRSDNYEAAADLLRRMCVNGELSAAGQTSTVIPAKRSVLAGMDPITPPQLGGQDIRPVYLEVLDGISVSRRSACDYDLSTHFQNRMNDFLHGEYSGMSISDELNLFCSEAAMLYPGAL